MEGAWLWTLGHPIPTISYTIPTAPPQKRKLPDGQFCTEQPGSSFTVSQYTLKVLSDSILGHISNTHFAKPFLNQHVACRVHFHWNFRVASSQALEVLESSLVMLSRCWSFCLWLRNLGTSFCKQNTLQHGNWQISWLSNFKIILLHTLWEMQNYIQIILMHTSSVKIRLSRKYQNFRFVDKEK